MTTTLLYDAVEVWHIAQTLEFEWVLRQVLRSPWSPRNENVFASARRSLTTSTTLTWENAVRLFMQSIARCAFFVMPTEETFVFLLVDLHGLVEAGQPLPAAVRKRIDHCGNFLHAAHKQTPHALPPKKKQPKDERH